MLARAALLLSLSTFSLAASAQKPAKLAYPKAAGPNEVFEAVAKPAVPAGGPQGFAAYLEKNQQYPAAAMQAGQQGTVKVSFVVGRSGYVEDVKVEQPVAPALDAEAVRLIKSAPRWTPAQHQGRVVRQRVVVPVAFALSPADEQEIVTLPGNAAPAQPLPAGATAAAPGTASAVEVAGPAVVAPDKPARPVGGTEKFFEWVQANQQYPALARQRKIQGKVMVAFTVQPDGSLADARVLRKMGSGLDEEALRLIRTAPKWEPASYQGKPLKQKMVLPVIFQL